MWPSQGLLCVSESERWFRTPVGSTAGSFCYWLCLFFLSLRYRFGGFQVRPVGEIRILAITHGMGCFKSKYKKLTLQKIASCFLLNEAINLTRKEKLSGKCFIALLSNSRA